MWQRPDQHQDGHHPVSPHTLTTTEEVMKAVNIPGVGTVLHPGTDEEVAAHEKFLAARMEFTASYCREKGWPVPGEPDFEDRISIEQIMEIRDQPGWKDPLQDGKPLETAVILGREQSVIIPKGRN